MVRVCHWLVTIAFLLLVYTGITILKAHPRLYWGETGNELTPALFELPISKNYKHGGWEKSTAFYNTPQSPVSASRTFEIYNENGWGRSLHFLAAWILFFTGIVYVLTGFFSKHFQYAFWPRRGELTAKQFRREWINHLRLAIPAATGGPDYGLLQKITYLAVVFVLFPLVILTGCTMSPAVTAAFPFLLKLFGGFQSARTIHFFVSLALELFLIIHIIMVIRSGFVKQIRAMTVTRSK